MKPSVKLVLVFACALAMLGAGIGLSAYNDSLYRTTAERSVLIQARILAASVSAGLAFDDEASVQAYLNALRANPQLEAGGAYDADGRLVASFARAGRLPQRVEPHGPLFAGGRVTVSVPVIEKGAYLGDVYLRMITEPLARRITRYAGLMLLFVMAALVVAALGVAQAALSRSNAELAEANRRLRQEIEERERAEEALRQSQKMEAIGRITGGVAHDFNNLLMVAASGLDLMERSKDPERRMALREGVRQALDRGADLTRQLLAFSRRSPLKSEVVDLGRHIDGMRVLLDRSLREDIRVERKVPADLWPVRIDPGQFELALLNVAVNARDAMPNGGEIVIAAENCRMGEPGGLQGDFVRLTVSDRGGGIDPEVLPHVFEPFFTTKEVGRGTGLGLSQVYGFARSSGGEARITSRLGEGTQVAFFFPRTEAAADQPAVEAEARPPLGSGKRVLMVEDDEGVAAMVSDMLTELGYRPERAATAGAALGLLQTARPFDLLFSDLVMPGGMDGIELARQVRRGWPDLPILLTTGFSEAAAAAEADGLRILPKPYAIESLAAALNAVLAGRPAGQPNGAPPGR